LVIMNSSLGRPALASPTGQTTLTSARKLVVQRGIEERRHDDDRVGGRNQLVAAQADCAEPLLAEPTHPTLDGLLRVSLRVDQSSGAG
jgi:hypothetical protein